MINVSELQNLVNILQDKTIIYRISGNSLYNASEEWASDAAKNPGFKNPTGVLSSAIDTNTRGLNSEIFVDADRYPYAEYVNDGTGIYGPKGREFFVGPPNTKKALSFVSGNNRFFSKGHMSKGQRPNPFIQGKGAVFSRRKSNFIKSFQNDFTDQLQELI